MKPSAIKQSGLLAALAGFAQAQFQDFFNITTFPNEQKENVTKWLNEARELAGADLSAHFGQRCIESQVYPTLYSATQPPGFVAPREVFDGVYYVGQSGVSAWAYDTGDGLVVIDSLDNAAEAQDILVGGLEAFGFAGSDIKHLVITHEHSDHYGGARYLQDTFKPATYASAAAWETMVKKAGGPVQDRVIEDGQVLRFGNVTFGFYLTPGHTPGTLSTIFDVYDNGVKHTAGLFGGIGIPSAVSAREQQIASLNRFAGLAKEAGVDTLIANHQGQDRSLYHFDLLEHRSSGAPNPFVIGVDAFDRYMRVVGQCVRVKSARDGLFLQS